MTDDEPAGDEWSSVTRRLASAVAPLLPGFSIEVLVELDSTNSELMRRARAGLSRPVLLVALHQSAGRGRQGRAWASTPGDSLTFSLGLPLAPADWSGLSLAVGVAVAEALHPRIGLKWPNDLWLDGRKLAGILVETAGFEIGMAAGSRTGSAADSGADAGIESGVGAGRTAPPGAPITRYAVVGVGINLAPRAAEGLSLPPAALRELLAQAEPCTVLQAVTLPLVQALQQFAADGFAPFQARYAARDVLRGRPVTLSDGGAGTATGVDGRGALLVHTAAGMRAITTAEVLSVRPALATPTTPVTPTTPTTPTEPA